MLYIFSKLLNILILNFFFFIEKNNIKGPLDYLISDDLEVPISSAVVESLLSQEKISYMCTAKLVHPWQKVKCEVLISENAIYIVPTTNIQNVNLFLM